MSIPHLPPTVLHTALPALWVRLFLLVVGVSFAVLIGGSSIAVLLSDVDPSPLGLLALLLPAPSAVVALAFLVLGQRPRFTVSTTGIEIRTLLRTHRILWAEVAVVEVDTGWVHQGQTVVVLHDGRRIGAPITEARSAMRRGEHTSDHGPGFRGAAIPTRTAIDAHRTWLQGELSGR